MKMRTYLTLVSVIGSLAFGYATASAHCGSCDSKEKKESCCSADGAKECCKEGKKAKDDACKGDDCSKKDACEKDAGKDQKKS